MNKHTFKVDGKEIKFEAKSHAQVFRDFWAHFMQTDLNKTIENIEIAGIRTSENEHFVAVNGQKKKNILVKENLYIYTHLTPKAMEKAYDKFVNAWEGKFEQPAEKSAEKSTEKKKVDKPEKTKTESKKPVIAKVDAANFLPKPKGMKTNAAEVVKRQMEEKARKKEEAKQRKLAKLNAEAEKAEKEMSEQTTINL